MSQPNRVLPPVRSADNSLSGAAQSVARKSGASVSESASATSAACAPAPLTATSAAPPSDDDLGDWTPTAKVESAEAPAEQTLTLAQLAKLVEKQKRGVREVVTRDIDEGADWDPAAGAPVCVVADSGANLARRMMRLRR